MSKAHWMAATCLGLLLTFLAWGCAGSAGSAVPLNAAGQHPVTWLQDHWAEYVKQPDQCRSCHGSTSDAALAGGISKVSCFACHAGGVNHPAGWGDAAQHGRSAKLAPSSDPLAMAGFAHCAKCHGDRYTNGLAGSCTACHTKAPHPDRPWYGTTASGTNHHNTDPANAPECAKCHLAGANSTLQPLTTPPAGTAPGCFNDTLCHSKSFVGQASRLPILQR